MASIFIPYHSPITLEGVNNTITFKKNHSIIISHEFPNFLSIQRNREELLIYLKTHIPSYIPKGYSNLTLDSIGLYFVTSDIATPEMVTDVYRKLFYFDTSIIDEEDYTNFFKNLGFTDIKLPPSFWFSGHFRNNLALIDPVSTIDDFIKFGKKFDKENYSTLIKKQELMCIMYENIRISKILMDSLPLSLKPISNYEMIYLEIKQDKEIYGGKLCIDIDNWCLPYIENDEKYGIIRCVEGRIEQIPINLNNFDIFSYNEWSKKQRKLGIYTISSTQKVLSKKKISVKIDY